MNSKRKNVAQRGNLRTNPSPRATAESALKDPPRRKKIHGGHRLKFVLDSGAVKTIVPEDALPGIKLDKSKGDLYAPPMAAHPEENRSRDWVRTQRRLKGKFAGTVARQTDRRWSTRLLHWMPWLHRLGGRDVGRPRSRWEHIFSKRAGGNWTNHAQDARLWGITLTEIVH